MSNSGQSLIVQWRGVVILGKEIDIGETIRRECAWSGIGSMRHLIEDCVGMERMNLEEVIRGSFAR